LLIRFVTGLVLFVAIPSSFAPITCFMYQPIILIVTPRSTRNLSLTISRPDWRYNRLHLLCARVIIFIVTPGSTRNLFL